MRITMEKSSLSAGNLHGFCAEPANVIEHTGFEIAFVFLIALGGYEMAFLEDLHLQFPGSFQNACRGL